MADKQAQCPPAAGFGGSRKVAYIGDCRAKLAELESRLVGIDSKLQQAIDSGQVSATAQLDRTRRALDQHLQRASRHIDRLEHAGSEDLPAMRSEMEDIWEDSSSALRKLLRSIKLAHGADRDDRR